MIRVPLILRETCRTLSGLLTALARIAILIRRPLFPLSVRRQVNVELVTLLAKQLLLTFCSNLDRTALLLFTLLTCVKTCLVLLLK